MRTSCHFRLPLMWAFWLLTIVGQVSCWADEPLQEAAAQPSVEEPAEKIDAFIEAALDQQGLTPLPITSDEQFVRRIYLDAIGRIPTLAEAREFLESSDPQKRARLIEALLRSRGHVSHQFNFWADILRIKDEDAAISRAFYINWVKESLASNKPYDEFVRELLTASGNGWQPGNGAVGYYLRDRGMPLDNMANTLRIFLGTQLACAQCHDHPDGHWTRRQFFEMAAFTSKLVTNNHNDLFGAIYQREKVTTDPDLQAFSQYIRNTYHADQVLGESDGQIEVPDDYQYNDAKPGAHMAARPLFGPEEVANDSSHADYRQRFGTWLTSPDNPRFTQVIANRLWKRAMGHGLIEPVDDLRADSVASHPELLDYLEQLMKDLQYDMRAYLQVLYNTKTYQRGADPEELADHAPASFRGRQLARMTAEQTWDSLLTLIVDDVDERDSGFFNSTIYYCGRPVLVGQQDMHSRFATVKDHDVDQHWEFVAAELKRMKDDLQSQDRTRGLSPSDAGRGFYRRMRSAGVFVRASELRAPAEPSHFLRTFGQSSRELIEGGNTASNVTQFLSMFNGIVEANVLQNAESELMKELERAETWDAKCDIAYQSILCRKPTSEERDRIASIPAPDETSRLRNLVWALVNSQEFIFVQ